MFTLAYFIGIYSYAIFTLGIFGYLTKLNIFLLTFVWFVTLVLFERSRIVPNYRKINKILLTFNKIYKSPTSLFFILFVLLMFVNLIGALGPELAFDALWYH